MSIAAAPAYAGSVFFKPQLLSQFQRILNVDVDLNAKLDEWKRFYNLARPHGAFKGKAPYDILRVSYNHHEDVSSPFEIIQQRSF